MKQLIHRETPPSQKRNVRPVEERMLAFTKQVMAYHTRQAEAHLTLYGLKRKGGRGEWLIPISNIGEPK